jgi:galactose mutarotase-like enzyme
MNNYSLENNLFFVNVSKNGAELQTIKNLKNNTELLWNPDLKFWNRISPVLFPIVGKLKNNLYEENGNTYSMLQHGFARNMEFEVIQQTQNSIAMQLQSNSETLAQYPFDFVLKISYILIENCLDIHYSVTNLSTVEMPFSIGAHPGFALNKPLNQYKLVFDQPFTADRYLIQDGLYTNETSPTMKNSQELLLSNELIHSDAVVFKNVPFYRVTLCELDNTPLVTVSSSDFPHWGFWSKPDAPFFCIEPWAGLADSIQATGNLRDKEGIEILAPNQTKQFSFSIEMPAIVQEN